MTPDEQEAKLRAKAAEAEEIKRLMDHPRFRDTVGKIKDNIQRQFLNCPLGEDGNQPRLFAQAKMGLLNEFVEEFRRVASGGKVASEDIIHLETQRKKREARKR